MRTKITFTLSGVLLIVFLTGLGRAQTSAPPVGVPAFEDYRREFAVCDAYDMFAGIQFPINDAQGKLSWRGCSDHSNLVRLEAISAKNLAPATILFEAKLAWDDDGSKKSCSLAHKSTSQCSTSLKLRASPRNPCADQIRERPYCVPTDPDLIPYIVIPGSGPQGLDAREFSKKTQIKVGDYAVVMYRTNVIAALVADEGPANKIGEGSTLLLKRLSGSRPITRDAGVVYITFPGTADNVDGLQLETLPNLVSQKGCSLYAALVGPVIARACR